MPCDQVGVYPIAWIKFTSKKYMEMAWKSVGRYYAARFVIAKLIDCEKQIPENDADEQVTNIDINYI
jgi:hypothetical protein